MATSTTNTKTTPASEMPATAQKIREQLVSTVRQGQQLSIDAAQNLVKAASVLPVADLPKVPGVPSMPSMQAATKYTFDLAEDLLNAQRDFALQLAGMFTPEKSV